MTVTKVLSTSQWYEMLYEAVKRILSHTRGAFAQTKQEWREALMDEDSRLRDCPESVFKHIGLGLKARGMACNALRYKFSTNTGEEILDGEVVVIYDTERFTLEEARAKCERDGLTPGAQEYFEEFEEVSA